MPSCQLHHVSALFVHHSRRVRLLTAGIHLSLLQIPQIRDQIFFFLRETASVSQIENVLGTWCIASHDIDRSVASTSSKSWINAIDPNNLDLDERFLPPLIAFIKRTILDPNGVYAYFNPAQPPAAPTPPPKKGPRRDERREDSEPGARSKAEDLEENEHDRKARLRVGAFGAVKRILGACHKG